VLWSFLKQGLEVNPPLGYVLAAGSQSIFGRNEFGVRLPSIIGFWVMSLCLYLYLRRRLPWPFAIAGMLLPALMAAGRYSYEARPYALVLALAGVALLAWQVAAAGRRRRAALVSLAIALAAALCSQAFAVTLALPLLAGEVTRTIQRKRVDWPVWCAFASASPALLVIWRLKSASDLTAYYRFSGSLPRHIAATYLQMLTPAAAPLCLAFLLVLILRRQATGAVADVPGMRTHELAALAGFALIPFAAVPISTLGGQYWPRYSLSCAIGLAGLLAALLFSMARKSQLCGVTVVVVLGSSFLAGQFLPADQRPDGSLKFVNSSDEIQRFLEQIPLDAPIVICPEMTFVELEHYSSAQVAARLYYLTDPAGAATANESTAFDAKGPLLGRFFPFRSHFVDYRSFVAEYKRFYVVRPMRAVARAVMAGRLSLQPRETAGHFRYYEARPH
jgi:hypothetical protein